MCVIDLAWPFGQTIQSGAELINGSVRRDRLDCSTNLFKPEDPDSGGNERSNDREGGVRRVKEGGSEITRKQKCGWGREIRREWEGGRRGQREGVRETETEIETERENGACK